MNYNKNSLKSSLDRYKYFLIIIALLFVFSILIIFFGQAISNFALAIQFCLIFIPFLIILLKEELHEKDNILRFLYYDIASIIATIRINNKIAKKIEDLTIDEVKDRMVKGEFDTHFIDKLETYSNKLKREMRRLHRYDLKYLAKFDCTILWIEDIFIRILNKYDLSIKGIKDIEKDDYITSNEQKLDEILSELRKIANIG